jgi:hypothetical protein
MQDCWSQEPAERPSFEAIARRIKALQRWRKLSCRLEHVGAAAQRTQSMPSIKPTQLEPTQPCAARKVVSVSAAEGNPDQQQQQLQRDRVASAVRKGLLLGVPPPPPSPLLPQLPPTDSGDSYGSVTSLQQSSLQAGSRIARESLKSLEVSSAVVHGTRVAIIPTPPAADEQDALASIADPGQLAAARVLLVASDLPARYAEAIDGKGLRD